MYIFKQTKKNLTSTAMDEGEKLTTQSPKKAIEPGSKVFIPI
jgi:hypothetical protein